MRTGPLVCSFLWKGGVELEAVIFDLDGTLLNRNASLIKFIDDQYERYKSELRLVDKEIIKTDLLSWTAVATCGRTEFINSYCRN
jgi:FMN phosphatase YigB (HAD superfamily)